MERAKANRDRDTVRMMTVNERRILRLIMNLTLQFPL
jgi:hypothetical protein